MKWAFVRDAEALAIALRKSGLKQVEIAALAGCTKQYISKLIKGRSSFCSIEIAHAIQEALQVRDGSLFVPTDLPRRKVHRNSQESAGAAEAAA